MPYRAAAAGSSPIDRVELLRFAPKPWYRHWRPLLAALALAWVGRAFDPRGWSATHTVAFVLWAAIVVLVLREWRRVSSTLVVSLERDASGRHLNIERSLFGWRAIKRFATEAKTTLRVETRDEFSLVLKRDVPKFTARVQTSDGATELLFETFDEDDADRFREATQGFDERALAVATTAQLEQQRRERERASDAEHRENDQRYLQWFEEVIAADDAEKLDEILARGFSLDRPVDGRDHTALDLAESRGAERCARALIARGATRATQSAHRAQETGVRVEARATSEPEREASREVIEAREERPARRS